jgi:hypothetical protein
MMPVLGEGLGLHPLLLLLPGPSPGLLARLRRSALLRLLLLHLPVLPPRSKKALPAAVPKKYEFQGH